MPPVVGIIGSYGGLNLGDEAILASVVDQLRSLEPEIEIVVFSRNAEHTRMRHAVDRTINARTALREQVLPELERLDMLLLGGGGILYDREARVYLREVQLAHEIGLPTFAYAVGIGPLSHVEERAAVRDGLNRMAGITVREVSAKRLCQEIGVTIPIEVTADPALLLDPMPFTDQMLVRESIPPDRRLIGFSVRERGGAAPDLEKARYHEVIADVADFCVRRYEADAVFVPMERIDRNEIHQVIALMEQSDRAHVLRGDYHPREIMGLTERFSFVAGMRLHFLIFAAVMGTPIVALPYAPKVQDLVSSLGVQEYMNAGDARTGSFLATLDRLWDNRTAQRAAINERLPALQQLARRTPLHALSVIGRGPGVDTMPSIRTGEDLANPPLSF
ncbi:polysaccharide pyruvyl transferase family protein [uncultured Ferrovibrio sp.]|jgi:polysaccharide pyruvyl transferase CsaB|uniref:polysaccharide pyruvyl transferase family protein n=1 Tax=uncultured Ferrovibrio sp. TaxID=1576913 RepID=UPI002622BF30|nr:polysaccharide pyruvyl transferase family protein [uncultured Ferrovibrio sp.]